jgi:hypothetical protein
MSATKRYLCLICGFIYDEALGLPDDERGTEERGRDLRRWMIAHLRTSQKSIPSVAPARR